MCWRCLSGGDHHGSYGFSSYGDGVDRRGWADKSDAALSREREAMNLFSSFLETAKSQSSSSFPLTEEIVPAHCHLTDACWKTFKKEVVAKGCKAKRVELTEYQKRQLPKDKYRKSKMYAIAVTMPIHPGKAAAAAEEKRLKAEAANQKKLSKAIAIAEKEKKEMEERRKKEAEIKALVEKDYAGIVKMLDSTKDSTSTDAKKRAHSDDEDESESSPESASKKLKIDSSSSESEGIFKLTAPVDDLLAHAKKMHGQEFSKISNTIASEKASERKRLLEELDARMKARESEEKEKALAHCDLVKESITKLASGKPISIEKPAEAPSHIAQ